MDKISRVSRRDKRKEGASALAGVGIPFLSKNYGAHLIVNPRSASKRVDFWPGTGLWRNYWGKPEGRGLDSLLSYLKSE